MSDTASSHLIFATILHDFCPHRWSGLPSVTHSNAADWNSYTTWPTVRNSWGPSLLAGYSFSVSFTGLFSSSCSLIRSTNLVCKKPDTKFRWFGQPKVLVATVQLCSYSSKAAVNNGWRNANVSIPIKHYLQKETKIQSLSANSWISPSTSSLLTSLSYHPA